MAKIMFDNKFSIMLDDGTVLEDIEGRFTKVKGYSEFTFFSHKMDGDWYIREFYTGRDIGHGSSEGDAKTNGKAYLFEHGKGDKKVIINRITSLPPINRIEDYE